MGDFIKINVANSGRYGKKNSDYSYEGGFVYKKLIRIFVELHYRFFGRPDWKTWTDIKQEVRNLEAEWPETTESLRKLRGEDKDD